MTALVYPFMLIQSSGSKTFSSLGRFIGKSADTVKRLLQPKAISRLLLNKFAQHVFAKDRKLSLVVDDTLICKIFSKVMCGTWWFFSAKDGVERLAFKLQIYVLTNGIYAIPIGCDFLFSKDFIEDPGQQVIELIDAQMKHVQEMFPNKHIILTADGAFSSRRILKWAINNNIDLVMRMHSNRVVKYNGIRQRLTEISQLIPLGRHSRKTIQAFWYDMPLYIISWKRINKNGKESVVFLVSTFKAKPVEYTNIYEGRWYIEKKIRTSKQSYGLQDCQSTNMSVQLDHMHAVLVAYAITQVVMKKCHVKVPEDAKRWIQAQENYYQKKSFNALDRIFKNGSL